MGNAEAEKAKVEQKLQTLQFQNGKLSAQLEVQRSQISELETRIEAQDAKQSSYADTLLTVNSLWSQLNADIQHLGTRASKVCNAAV
jgi:E3 ubiquitin-protein ligase BRE1